MLVRLIACAFFAIVALPGATSHAQTLTLSPAVVPLAGSCGQSVTQVLTLQNDTDLALDFTLEARDVVVRDGTRRFLEAGQLVDSIAASAVFVPRELHVAAHANAIATVTFTLPVAMRHRAVVAIAQGGTPLTGGDRPMLLSLGALFTFTVSEHVSVAAGALDAEAASVSAPARLRSTLTNDGAEPVVLSGMAVILDAGGRMIGKIPFAARRLLPGEAATFVADYPGELSSGAYRTVATFDVAGRALTLTGSLDVP